jgi:putative transposase
VTLTESDLSELLAAVQAGAMTDTIRTSLAWVLQQLIEAELTSTISASPHERTGARTAQRNGHRPKLITTAAGDIELQIPKLRTGSFFPSLLERRRRIDRALFAVVMEAWVHGVSTRKVDDLVKALGQRDRFKLSRRSAGSAPSWTGTSRRSAPAAWTASSPTCSATPPMSKPA